MKHRIIIAVCLLGLLGACNSDKKEIRRVAQGYLDATGNYLIDEAMPYANQQTQETTLKFLNETLIPITPKEYMESNTPATIHIDSIDVQGDTACVSYTKTTPIKTLSSKIDVVREESGWLVNVPLILPESMTVNGMTHEAVPNGEVVAE